MGLRQTREAETFQWNDPKVVTSLVVDYFWREAVAELEKAESLHPYTTLQCKPHCRPNMEARGITVFMIQAHFPAFCWHSNAKH